MINETKTLTKADLEELCRENIVGARANGPDISVPMPQSEREAENLAYFWRPVFKENKNEIKEIQFVYQEKDKELPLSYIQKFSKRIGFGIRPEIEEGKIGELFIYPESIRQLNGHEINVITTKENWTPLNKLAQKCNTFNAPFVLMPENLCYQVNIPLECIKSVKFKGDFY